MKDFEIIEKNYLYLLKYFDGDVKNLNLDDLKKLKKGIFKGEQVNKIDDEPYKLFKFIVNIRNKEPKKYAKMRFVMGFFIYFSPEKNEKSQFQK